MSDRPVKLLLIDPDPIFRLGLRVALEEVPNLRVVSEVKTYIAALDVLAELVQKDPTSVNLVVMELGNSYSTFSQQLDLQCRHLKTQYPNLPVLLLSSVQEKGLLKAARAAGVDGYCPKGTSVFELVTAMQEVVRGRSYWDGEVGGSKDGVRTSPQRPFARLRNNLHLSGINYINATLVEVTAQLQVPGLPLLDRAILAGQRRELLAASWLLNRLLASPYQMRQMLPPAKSKLSSSIPKLDLPETQSSPTLRNHTLQAALFASCISKLQFPLKNVTDIPLEIDILCTEKKRKLLYMIMQKIADILDEMRNSQIDINQLNELKNTVLLDIWRAETTDFFGKFSRIRVGNSNLEIVNLLLQDAAVVQTEILNKIPLVVELFSHLLFQTDLQIDNASYPVDSFEAKEQAEMLFENLLIQIANGVVQPLLNSLADVEAIKQSFYDRQLISTREIERFRNNLSWKYRIRNYITEAQEIFESRYEVFVFAPHGIATVSIYASRGQELAQLSGIPLFVTLVLEFRDAIAPRLQSLLSFLGSGLVFVLTQIIGRAIGLIGRGILQGLGRVSLPERRK